MIDSRKLCACAKVSGEIMVRLMKTRTLLLVGAAVTVAFFPQTRAGEEQQKKPGTSVTAPASEEIISLEVTGMT